MMSKNGYSHDMLMISLERALSILGDSSKQLLMSYIAEYCGRKCSIAEIESALKSVFGEGSALITSKMFEELEKA